MPFSLVYQLPMWASRGRSRCWVVAQRYRKGLMSAAGREFLMAFSLPLAARRDLDSAFFVNPYYPELANTLMTQASLKGRCQALLVANDPTFADVLDRVADSEAIFRNRIERLG